MSGCPVRRRHQDDRIIYRCRFEAGHEGECDPALPDPTEAARSECE